MEVTCLEITPDGLKPIDRTEVKFNFDALPKHKQEGFMIGQLKMIQKWAAAQEAAAEGGQK